jgi:hypothetical protein
MFNPIQDEVYRTKFHFQPHDDTLTTSREQPGADLILERNAELRQDNSLKDLDFGRQVASIPFIVYEQAIRDGYQLNAPDSAHAGKEMMRFLKTPEGQMCMCYTPKVKYHQGGI